LEAAKDDEDVTDVKKRRLRGELDEALRILNGLVNSNDPAYTQLRQDLRATGDPGMPAHDWKSCKI
jgi:hypothetical protein